MTVIQDMLNEIQAALDSLESPVEGLSDFASLDISEDTRGIVRGVLSALSSRRTLLVEAQTSLRRLLQDGYPDSRDPRVTAAAAADMREQIRTLNLAYAFLVPSASSLNLSAKPAEMKEN